MVYYIFISSSVIAGSNSTLLRCAVSAGVGSNLVFVMSMGSLFSVTGADTLSYPPPSITSNSLRRNNVNYISLPALAFSSSEGMLVLSCFVFFE